MTETLAFFVPGLPVTQGSIRSLGKGRPSIHGNADRLKPWRLDIASVAADARSDDWLTSRTMDVQLHFTLPRPKSLSKRASLWVGKRPDIDKLARAVLDALTFVVYGDDAQVAALSASKRYATEGAQVGLHVTVGYLP